MRGGSQVIDAAPPAADTGGGGGWALLLTARGIIEAELIRGVLESQGIVPVALDATDPSPGAWLFLSGNVNALVRVFVPTSLLDAARLTLMEAGVASHDVAEPPPADRAHGDRGRIWMAWVALTIVVVAIFLLATMRASVI